MRILMLGWEFPPYISGGLGTACYGLTRALDALGHEVIFVLPKPVDRSHASHVDLRSPQSPAPTRGGRDSESAASPRASAPSPAHQADPSEESEGHSSEMAHVSLRGVPAMITSPYPGMAASSQERWESISVPLGEGLTGYRGLSPMEASELATSLCDAGIDEDVTRRAMGTMATSQTQQTDYDGDVMLAAARYAEMVNIICAHDDFDVIHAHDWMTYPAGLAMARRTGKPLVIHVHSTEFDRSGEHVNQQIYNIERAGMHGADRVACVSFLTQSICASRYAVPDEKLRVVYNGVDLGGQEHFDVPRVEEDDKIVLFLGRITMQKGPEYFIAAAKRVLEKVENVKFIVAGSGDMARRMIEMAASMGIGHKVLFTGFLRGKDVATAFSMADCYVMPSVSEPFGIAPLEALGHDVPVIISKQSGVSEVLTHALKVDFWDTDEMANKIIAVLRHAPLSRVLRQHGSWEVRRLTWEGAASKTLGVYQDAIDLHKPQVVVRRGARVTH
ncbi:MAG: glycosyltransferase family 4 protein [Planctomycetota bacterium]|jgi:glycosyltransferase involved in cell wall biosynthesis